MRTKATIALLVVILVFYAVLIGASLARVRAAAADELLCDVIDQPLIPVAAAQLHIPVGR